jgi:hypothetical protein
MLLAILLFFSVFNARAQWTGMRGGFIWIFENTKDITKLQASFANFENFISENIIGREKFVEFYAYLQKLMGKQEIDNFGLIRDTNGQMVYGEFDPEDLRGIGVKEAARRVWRLQQAVADRETKVFFLNPPAMHISGERKYPPGMPRQDVNHRQDAFLYWLNHFNIDYLDLRETLARRDIPVEDYFYATDHHWRIGTAFAAFADLIDWMDRYYGAGLDQNDFFKNRNNYHSKIYKNASLGSMGRRTGIVYSGLDDFEVIWPRFDEYTNFTYIGRFTEAERRVQRSGPFTESLLYPAVLQTSQPYQTDFYSVYHSGIKSHEKIINHMNSQAPRLLMIRDSFCLPLGAFMAPMFSEIHMLWPVSGELRLNIEEYIRENDFDYILVELSETGLFVDNFYWFPEPFEGEEAYAEWEIWIKNLRSSQGA